jgi:hypothetical protein
MSEADKASATVPEPAPRPGGRFKQTVNSAIWVRVMRLVIAVAAAYLLYHAATRFIEGHLSPTDSWLIGMVGTLGLSALIEAIWPEGRHALLQFWCLTTLAASALVSWAAGGEKWLGTLGAVLLAISFLIAAGVSAGRRTNDAS